MSARIELEWITPLLLLWADPPFEIVQHPRGGRMSRGWNIEDTRAIREVLLDRIGRFPRPAAQLFAAVSDDFGTVCRRRMWRALERLLKRGEVVRVGRKWQPEGYVRATQQRRSA